MRVFLSGLVMAVTICAQSGGPMLDAAFALDRHLKGRAELGSGPIVAYDISYPARARIGQGTVDAAGNFAVSVKPALKQGNRIIVEDRFKRVSSAVTVGSERSSPLR